MSGQINIPGYVVVLTDFPHSTGMRVSNRGSEYVPSFDRRARHSADGEQDGRDDGEARELHRVRYTSAQG